MSLLTDYFPNILKNEFKLKALNLSQAKLAIEVPANLKETYFLSPRYSFEEVAIASLLDRLEEDKSGFIDPIQLQIVASNIEKKVARANTVISKNQIPNIKSVITSFYRKKWGIVKSKSSLRSSAFYEVREGVLNKLIVNGNRNLVHEESLGTIDGGLEVADLLKDEGIVKVEQKNEGKFYSLSHDRMLRPAINDLRKIKIDRGNKIRTKKKMNIVFSAFGLCLLGLLIAGFLLKNNVEKKRQDAYMYSLKKKEILSKEFEFANDSMRLEAIDSIVRITNDKIEATIAKVEQSSIPDTEKNVSIKSLENLKSPTTIIRYYKRRADGDVVTNVIRTLDTTKYQLSIKESLEIDPDNSGKVNTIYYGHNVPKAKVIELRNKLNEKEELITSAKPFEGGGGYELKNNAIEILHETHDKKYQIRMYAYNPNHAVKSLMTDFLGEYYQLKVYPDWKDKPSFFSSVPTVLYYSDLTENEALHLTNGLDQLLESENVEFVYRRGYGLGVSESDKKNTFIIHYVGD